MNKIKVMTILGTRPEIIRLSRVLPALDRSFDHILVHTGQNYDYELDRVFFDEMELRAPDLYLNVAASTEASTATVIANIISHADHQLEIYKPDAVLVLGDTNSCLSVIAAKRRKIPIFHMEAGNRCYDQRVPEEINRRIVDHTADINMPYSSIAREYLLSEGLPADRIIKTGSPMYEVLKHYENKILTSNVLDDLKLRPSNYFVVSAHREENIESEKSFKALMNSLDQLASNYSLPVIVSTHPRMRKKIDQFNVKLSDNIQFLKPMGFFDYVKLQSQAKAVLSDSGTISEESSILKFPALNIREAHERPEAMEEGAVMMVGTQYKRIAQGLRILESREAEQHEPETPRDYLSERVSDKVVNIIASYTDYVSRTVWKLY